MNQILLVENLSTQLGARKSILENAGYEVTLARSAQAARDVLMGSTDFSLAIVDIRLVDDGDEADDSGLHLAREIAADHKIPTLIMTMFENYEYVRRAHSWFPTATLEHMNFVGKNENPARFLNVIQNLLKNRRVFIVHGHDKGARDTIELFIRQLKLEPIVLEDQSHLGKTIIGQLEHHSNVAYVLVVLTPDDICEGDGKRGRARQNVILELGYFIGKYGLARVKALVVGDVELPSDIFGVLYIPFGDGEWKIKLVREMRDAGLDVHL